MSDAELITRLDKLEDRLSHLESKGLDPAYFAAQRAKALALKLGFFCAFHGDEAFDVIPLSATEVDVLVIYSPSNDIKRELRDYEKRIVEAAKSYGFEINSASLIPKK